ncbi:MAG: hypothetical protein ACUVV0_14775 [Anaerolineae bacterium]
MALPKVPRTFTIYKDYTPIAPESTIKTTQVFLNLREGAVGAIGGKVLK